MNHIVDTWLTRFAAGAGSQYEWHLIGCMDRYGRIESLLRAFVSPKVEMCPLSAQATYETGGAYSVLQWREAARQQGMAEGWNSRVIEKAADDDYGADPEVRTRLLRICGLVA